MFRHIQVAAVLGTLAAIAMSAPSQAAEGKIKTKSAITAATKAGTKFRDCRDCPEMMVIAPGSFTMGEDSTDAVKTALETPPHQVTIAHAFAIGVYQLTRGEYAEFAKATKRPSGDACYVFTGEHFDQVPNETHDWRSVGFKQTDRDPVVCVSWQDAHDYVAWLAKKTGKPYRLLTEAEYEYAARAGTTTRWYWGDDPSLQCQYGNWGDQALKRAVPARKVADCDDKFAYTAPVGSFKPNPWGLYDMGGNTTQWVEDCGHPNYDGAPTDGSAWLTGECKGHVERGGAWALPVTFGRSAGIRPTIPNTSNHSSEIGFRVGMTLN